LLLYKWNFKKTKIYQFNLDILNIFIV